MKLKGPSAKNGVRRSMRRVMGTGAALATAVIAVGVSGTPSAYADTTTKWQRQDSEVCIGAGSAANPVLTAWCFINADIRYNVHRWRDGTYELKSLGSGQCLDDSNAYGLRVFTCNATQYQSWWLHRWNDGTTQLKNQATGRCVDESPEFGVRSYPCNATVFQSWIGTW
ncbi:RICIN domain-containing protein [Actinomadura rupiterrae]|uniref:RICIN domain-containing protein n=1 Tax=Actinomadura rupiterrae TaxID=559627 RepID=UPI0020A3BC89|nr:RICIN domain-containing protein [Actinomadura rupiterrae]MCP2337437.1 hypothetical protein [Actinomadura rupiterrae]